MSIILYLLLSKVKCDKVANFRSMYEITHIITY